MDITILDGGMGRELEKVGAPFRQPEWSALALMQDAHWVSKVHDSFIRSGAEVIITNAYAVVPFHLGETVFNERGFELAALAAELAFKSSRAAASQVMVAGCIPPLFGSYQPELFNAELAPALNKVLVESQDVNVDLWLAETMSCIAEFKSARDAVDKYGTNSKPFWVSFSIKDELVDGKAVLRSGESLSSAVEAAIGRCQAVLINCSQPEYIIYAVSELSELLSGEDVRVGAYANAFIDDHDTTSANSVSTAVRVDLTPQKYLDIAKQWVKAGATIIGGCCGTGPEHIELLGKLKNN